MKATIHSFKYSLDYLREQVSDVPEDNIAVQPEGVRNHPLWTIGHLAFTSEMLGGVIGVEGWLPESWAASFGFGSDPSGDNLNGVTKAEALAMLAEAERRLSEAVLALDNRALDAPFPDESYLEVFPTIRHALTQVLIGHTAYHVGQVGVWRSAMGLPPMNRSYE